MIIIDFSFHLYLGLIMISVKIENINNFQSFIHRVYFAISLESNHFEFNTDSSELLTFK